MSILTMDMSSYEVDKIDHAASQYDAEVLCAGWIPNLALQQSPGIEHRVEKPAEPTAASINIFLNRMYSLQR
jgi:hypothetical protein